MTETLTSCVCGLYDDFTLVSPVLPLVKSTNSKSFYYHYGCVNVSLLILFKFHGFDHLKFSLSYFSLCAVIVQTLTRKPQQQKGEKEGIQRTGAGEEEGWLLSFSPPAAVSSSRPCRPAVLVNINCLMLIKSWTWEGDRSQHLLPPPSTPPPPVYSCFSTSFSSSS